MKKRPFVLVEVLIAIAILAICAFPLIGSPQLIYNRQKNTLVQIELERQAELYFYSFLKDQLETISLQKVSSKFKEKTADLVPLEFKIEGLGTFKYKPHYHLYFCNHKPSNPRKLWVAICFTDCKYGDKNFDYKFAFSVKNMDQKSPDLQGEGKEKSEPHDEEAHGAIHSSN